MVGHTGAEELDCAVGPVDGGQAAEDAWRDWAPALDEGAARVVGGDVRRMIVAAKPEHGGVARAEVAGHNGAEDARSDRAETRNKSGVLVERGEVDAVAARGASHAEDDRVAIAVGRGVEACEESWSERDPTCDQVAERRERGLVNNVVEAEAEDDGRPHGAVFGDSEIDEYARRECRPRRVDPMAVDLAVDCGDGEADSLRLERGGVRGQHGVRSRLLRYAVADVIEIESLSRGIAERAKRTGRRAGSPE